MHLEQLERTGYRFRVCLCKIVFYGVYLTTPYTMFDLRMLCHEFVGVLVFASYMKLQLPLSLCAGGTKRGEASVLG